MKKVCLILMVMFLTSLCLGAGGTYPIRHNTVQPAKQLARLLQNRIGTLDDEVTALEASQNGIFSNIGTGSVWYVDSGAGAGGAGTTWATAFDTLQEGIDAATDLRGDIVYVAQDHGETINNAASLTANCPGLTIVGIGNNESQPEIVFITDTTAELTISAADVCIYNMRFRSNIADCATAIQITADGDGAQILGCEFRETSNILELLKMINTAAAADELVIVGNRFIGTDSADPTNAIFLGGASNKTIIQGNHFIGTWSASVIDGTTALSTGLVISDNLIDNLDATAGMTIRLNASTGGALVGNVCYSAGAGFALVGDAMFVSPDNVAMNTANVETRNYETMFGPYRGDAAGTAGDSIFADFVLIDALIDLAIADFIDYQLDSLAGVSTTVDAGNNLTAHVLDKTVLSHIMTKGADTSDYSAATMSLEKIAEDAAAVLVDTGTDLVAQIAGITSVIAAMDDNGYAAVCETNAGGDTHVICATLGGFGADYFNTGWSLIVIKNASGVGTAPEGDIIDITDYTNAGDFTLGASTTTEAVTVNDMIMLKRTEELELDTPTILGSAGAIWYLDSTATGDATAKTWENASLTLTAVEALMAAGDICYIASNHDEEIGSVVLNLANTSFIGMGEGDGRPLLTVLNNGDEITIGAAGITLKNLRLEPSETVVAQGILVDAAGIGCTLENISFIEAETTNDEFVICIDLHASAAHLTVKDCTYYNLGATTTHTSCFIDLTAGTIDDCTIIGCNLFGEFANGAIYSNQVCTNLNIIDNVISNTTTTKLAINLSGASTGSLVNNRLYSDSYGTMLDPGELKCTGNIGADDHDEQGIAMPLSAETSDVGEVAAGSNLERLEWLQKQADDMCGKLGIDATDDEVWYVRSGAGGAADGTNWTDAEVTLTAGIGDATTGTGATIFVASNHAENLVGAVAVNKAGINIIGLGVGDARPKLTFDTANDCLTHTVANVRYKNIIFICSTQDTTIGVSLDGASDGAIFEDCEFRNTTTSEFADTIALTAACDNVRISRCTFNNTTATGGHISSINSTNGPCDNVIIEDCIFYGTATTAFIESDQIDLNWTIRDNSFYNYSTGAYAINCSAAMTGTLYNNVCYGDTFGQVIDSGSLQCFNNRVSLAIDESGIVTPQEVQVDYKKHGTGQVFYVDVSGSNGGGRTPATAKTSLDAAIGLCTSNRGDFIYVMQGHAETIGAATAFTLDIAGISIIGLGNGDNRPIFNMGNAGSTIVTTNAGDNILIENIKFLATAADVAICIDIVDGTDNVTIKNCMFDASTDGTHEFNECILVGNACIGTTIDGCTFQMAAGNATSAIGSDNDTDHTTIKNCLITGDYTVACVEFSTVASTDMHILDNIMINGDLVGDAGLHDQPCLEIFDSGGGFIKGNFFAADMAGNHLAITDADDFVFMENFTTDDDGDAFEGSQRSGTAAVTVSADG